MVTVEWDRICRGEVGWLLIAAPHFQPLCIRVQEPRALPLQTESGTAQPHHKEAMQAQPTTSAFSKLRSILCPKPSEIAIVSAALGPQPGLSLAK